MLVVSVNINPQSLVI